MPADNFDKGILSAAARMLDVAVTEGGGYDNCIQLFSLMCLLSILNRNQPVQQSVAMPAAGNPLQKLIGELSKGEAGGPSPDTLMSLLPLLNNPQIKSKMNPGTIAAVMGLLNNMGSSGASDKAEAKTEKQEKTEKPERTQPKAENIDKNELPAASVMTSEESENLAEALHMEEQRHPGRNLNWKSSF